jgi:hypothetical protein
MQVETRVESAWFQRLKLKYDKLRSSLAFNFNLHPYMAASLKELTGRAWETNCKLMILPLLASFPFIHFLIVECWSVPARVTRYPISILSSPISILSSPISILSSYGHLPYRYYHLPFRYCHLMVIFHIDTVIFHINTVILRSFSYRYCHLVILSSCGQDDHIVSCHSAGALVSICFHLLIVECWCCPCPRKAARTRTSSTRCCASTGPKSSAAASRCSSTPSPIACLTPSREDMCPTRRRRWTRGVARYGLAGIYRYNARHVVDPQHSF